MNERKMPHNLDAEQAVLGSMFLSKNALEKSLDQISDYYFYLESHSKIFNVIKCLAEKGTPIDITTVTAELDKQKLLNSIGGVEYKLKSAVKKGADLFIVPNDSNYDEAIKLKEKNNYKIEILGVSTFDEVIEYLTK